MLALKIACFFEMIQLKKTIVMCVKALVGKMMRKVVLWLTAKGKGSQQKYCAIFH
jgi:hypothetical protein